MQRASDRMFAKARGNLCPWRRFGLLFLALAPMAGLFAGCGLSPDWRPTPAPPAEVVPGVMTKPTEFVLSSEALYRDDLRHIGATSSDLASLPAGAILPPAPSGDSARGVSLALDNRTTLKGELYKQGGRTLPAILMLGADLFAWGSLPNQLSDAGFVVLVLQTHLLPPARQVDLILQSLIAIPGVDAGAIGLIGESHSADLAMLGCAVNTLCDALALFSPTSRATLLDMIPSFGERPLWLAAGRSDSESHAAALALSQGLRGGAQLIELDQGSGADLLRAEPGLADQLVNWFTFQLRDSRTSQD